MSDESDKHLQALFDRQRALLEKFNDAKLSDREQSALVTEVQSIGKEIERLTGCKVVEVDPIDAAKAEAKAIYDAHYRRKAELDRRLFGPDAP